LAVEAITGNSKFLICMDRGGSWNALFYPHIAQYQNLRTLLTGIYTDSLRWLGTDTAIYQDYIHGTNAVMTVHSLRSMKIRETDIPHPNHDLVIRKMEITNLGDEAVSPRLFVYEDLNIRESPHRDTAVFDRPLRSIIHFKEDLYFLFAGDPHMDLFTCGESDIKGLAGSHVDAEDGSLDLCPVANGSVDACLQWNVGRIPPGESRTIRLFLTMGRNFHQVRDLITYIRTRKPGEIEIESTRFWKSWCERAQLDGSIPEGLREIFLRSAILLRMLVDSGGGIVASPDFSSLKETGDSYNYVWWRDAALIVIAMDEIGLYDLTQKFFDFAQGAQTEKGFFLHRHLMDGSVGSSWLRPPFIQIDQTGLVLYSMWHHYRHSRDLDWLLGKWPTVKRAANFLVDYRLPNGLPKPSYDLWEERFSVSTFSVASVWVGLESASLIAQALGKVARRRRWKLVADNMREAAISELYDPHLGRFVQSVSPRSETVDAAILSPILFGMVDPDSVEARNTAEAVRKSLWRRSTGGLARYEGDHYCGDMNAWIICTLWLADVSWMTDDLDEAERLLRWVVERATPTGLLPEQVAGDGHPASVVPLTWSHAGLIWTTWHVAERLRQRGTPSGVPFPEKAVGENPT